MFRSYNTRVQCSCGIAVIIGIAIDTDPGWNGVSTLAAREAN